LVAETSFIGESAASMAAFVTHLRTDEDARSLFRRRIVAGVAVAVLHLGFILILIEAMWLPPPRAKPQLQAPLLWLLLPSATNATRSVPQLPAKSPLYELPNAITLPVIPPKPTQQTTDPALSLGQALACGASSYEYLPYEMQAKCKHTPWHYVYDRDGYIVLDATPRVREPEHKESGVDRAQHIMNTGDPCLAAKAAGTECADQIIFGNGPR